MREVSGSCDHISKQFHAMLWPRAHSPNLANAPSLFRLPRVLRGPSGGSPQAFLQSLAFLQRVWKCERTSTSPYLFTSVGCSLRGGADRQGFQSEGSWAVFSLDCRSFVCTVSSCSLPHGLLARFSSDTDEVPGMWLSLDGLGAEPPCPRFLPTASPCPVRLRGSTSEAQSLNSFLYFFL